MIRLNLRCGFSILEIVVSAAVIALVVTAGAGAFQLYFKAFNASGRQVQAALLAEEYSEALRLMRDQSWTENIQNLSDNSPYYLFWNGSQYASSAAPAVLENGFIVKITPAPVTRSTETDEIVNSGGMPDPGTRKIRMEIARESDRDNPEIVSNLLIHDLFQN